ERCRSDEREAISSVQRRAICELIEALTPRVVLGDLPVPCVLGGSGDDPGIEVVPMVMRDHDLGRVHATAVEEVELDRLARGATDAEVVESLRVEVAIGVGERVLEDDLGPSDVHEAPPARTISSSGRCGSKIRIPSSAMLSSTSWARMFAIVSRIHRTR